MSKKPTDRKAYKKVPIEDRIQIGGESLYKLSTEPIRPERNRELSLTRQTLQRARRDSDPGRYWSW